MFLLGIIIITFKKNTRYLIDKAETGNLMSSFTTMKFDGIGSIREYIMKGIEYAAKLKNLGVNIDYAFLVHLDLNCPSSIVNCSVIITHRKRSEA